MVDEINEAEDGVKDATTGFTPPIAEVTFDDESEEDGAPKPIEGKLGKTLVEAAERETAVEAGAAELLPNEEVLKERVGADDDEDVEAELDAKMEGAGDGIAAKGELEEAPNNGVLESGRGVAGDAVEETVDAEEEANNDELVTDEAKGAPEEGANDELENGKVVGEVEEAPNAEEEGKDGVVTAAADEAPNEGTEKDGVMAAADEAAPNNENGEEVVVDTTGAKGPVPADEVTVDVEAEAERVEKDGVVADAAEAAPNGVAVKDGIAAVTEEDGAPNGVAVAEEDGALNGVAVKDGVAAAAEDDGVPNGVAAKDGVVAATEDGVPNGVVLRVEADAPKSELPKGEDDAAEAEEVTPNGEEDAGIPNGAAADENVPNSGDGDTLDAGNAKETPNDGDGEAAVAAEDVALNSDGVVDGVPKEKPVVGAEEDAGVPKEGKEGLEADEAKLVLDGENPDPKAKPVEGVEEEALLNANGEADEDEELNENSDMMFSIFSNTNSQQSCRAKANVSRLHS